MENIISNTTGWIHTLAACVALITGTVVILGKKGTSTHKKVGYVYVLSMVVMLVTAFMIYRLFDGFGIFHIFAVVSVLTLSAGMLPALARSSISNWLSYHYYFMNWSVVGLYAAFVSEICVRFVPLSQMGWIVSVATCLVVGIGAWLIHRHSYDTYVSGS